MRGVRWAFPRQGEACFVPIALWPGEQAATTPYGEGWIAVVQKVEDGAVSLLCSGYMEEDKLSLAAFRRHCILLLPELGEARRTRRRPHHLLSLAEDVIHTILSSCSLDTILSFHAVSRVSLSLVRRHFAAAQARSIDAGTELKCAPDATCVAATGSLLVCGVGEVSQSQKHRGKLRVWSLTDKEDSLLIDHETDSSVTAVAVCEETRRVACSTAGSVQWTSGHGSRFSPATVRLYLPTGPGAWENRRSIQLGHNGADALCFSNCGLLVGGIDGRLRCFNSHNLLPLVTPPVLYPGACVTAIATAPSKRQFLAAHSDGVLSVFIWSRDGQTLSRDFEHTLRHSGVTRWQRVRCKLSVSASAIAASFRNEVHVWCNVCWAWAGMSHAPPIRLCIGRQAGSHVTALQLGGGFLWAAVTNLGRIEVWKLPSSTTAGSTTIRVIAFPSGHGNAVTGIAIAEGALFTSSASHGGERTLLRRQIPSTTLQGE